MALYVHVFSSYAICYAIGFMVFVRPRVRQPLGDRLFYASLLTLATLRFLCD
jgi:hypothetical protein